MQKKEGFHVKVLKILVALNLIAFLVVSQSDEAIAFDTSMIDYSPLQSLNKGEWSVGVKLGGAGDTFPGSYIRICPISHIEVLGLFQMFNLYYGIKMKCLEENNSFPSITLGFINGLASHGFEGDDYKIDSLYLTFSKNVKNSNMYSGIGKGNTPLVRDIEGDPHYNVNDYYLYGGIEKVIGKFKMFLVANRFFDDAYYKFSKFSPINRSGKSGSSIYFIGCSYKINKFFVVKLTGGILSEKFFELPKNENYYLMPALTIEYNRRKGE